MPTLTLILKNRPLGDYDLIDGGSITIGRREDNDVVIDDPAVSGHHAKIDALGNRFVMTDLQSKNGSFVNEQLIHSHWLKDGDVINIGGHCLAFKQNGAANIDAMFAAPAGQHMRLQTHLEAYFNRPLGPSHRELCLSK